VLPLSYLPLHYHALARACSPLLTEYAAHSRIRWSRCLGVP
jgi:hypothetical protein